MAKNSIADYSATAASNTDIQSVDIDEGCAPSGINNAIRELMADLADMNAGTTVLTSPSASALTLADGSSSAPALANTGDTNTGIFFPAADTVGVAVGGTEVWRYGSNPTTAKNLIQNGAMTVAQRYSVSGVGGSQTYTTCDRFKLFFGTGSEQGRVTTTQDTDVPSGGGFSSSLKIDCTTAESAVASGELFALSQDIEAQNLQHLLYGNAAAKTLALSFWFKSPKSGTHCVALRQPDGSRSYVREFTVASADTWEEHTVTFAGDASGTINNDTGAGLSVVWPLVAGSDFQVTPDQWAAGSDYATSNQQNLLDNTANNVYITGVQLEVGSVATDFEHEDYGTTLQKCLRYFRAISQVSNEDVTVASGHIYQTNRAWLVSYFPVRMRIKPTISFTGTTTDTLIRHAATGSTGAATPSVQREGTTSIAFLVDAAFGTPFTVGQACELEINLGTNNSAYFFSADL